MNDSELEARLRALRPSAPDPEVRRRIAAELNAEPVAVSRGGRWPRWTAAAVAAGLLLAAGAWLFLPQPAPSPVAVAVAPIDVVPVPESVTGPEALSFGACRRAAAGPDGALMELLDAASGNRSGRSEPVVSFSSWSELFQKDSL